MSQPIKFRAWIPKWGMYSDIYSINFYDAKPVSIEVSAPDHGRVVVFIKENGVILMQSTNLLDKRGKEIYEGDIVTYTAQFDHGIQELNKIVHWDNALGYILFRESSNELMIDRMYEIGHDALEVIGNACENIELAKAVGL